MVRKATKKTTGKAAKAKPAPVVEDNTDVEESEDSERVTGIDRVIQRVVKDKNVQPNWEAFVEYVKDHGGPTLSVRDVGIVVTGYKYFQKSDHALQAREVVSQTREEARAAREAAQEQREQERAQREQEKSARAEAREAKAAKKTAASKKSAAAASKAKATPKATAGKKTVAKKATGKRTAKKAAF